MLRWVIRAAAANRYKNKVITESNKASSKSKDAARSFNRAKREKDNTKLKSIELVRNKDIVEFLSKNNKHRPNLVIGFAAETENINKNAFSKLKQKNCDLIVVNDVSKKDSGFNSD